MKKEEQGGNVLSYASAEAPQSDAATENAEIPYERIEREAEAPVVLERLIYIGPGFRGVAQGTIYLGELPENLKDAIEKEPAIRELLVSPEKLVESQKSLRDPDSGLSKLYHYVESRKKGD